MDKTEQVRVNKLLAIYNDNVQRIPRSASNNKSAVACVSISFQILKAAQWVFM